MLKKINGSTYYIPMATNIGVYSFKNKQCIIVDTGLNNTQGRKIDEDLKEASLHPKYIVNTHSHGDHCGGNDYFRKNYTGAEIYTSYKESIFIENPELYAAQLFAASPIKKISYNIKPSKVNYVLEYGINKINDEKFDVISLKGHSMEQIGIITPDKVCFLGDSIFSNEILQKYSLPYYYNLKEGIQTLEYIKSIQSDYFVIAHSENILDREQIIKLSEENLKNIDMYKEEILELLDQPLTKEDLVEQIAILNSLELDFKEAFISYASISAFISYFYEEGLVTASIEGGKLYYYKQS